MSRVSCWVALHTALLFWITSLTWAAIHLCPVTDRGEQKSLKLPERFHFLSGHLVSLSNPRAILPFSCISSHTPGHSIAVLSRKITRAMKKQHDFLGTSKPQLLHLLKRHWVTWELRADVFAMQLVPGLGVTAVAYGISSRFGFWDQTQFSYFWGGRTGASWPVCYIILRKYRMGSVDYSSVFPVSPASVQVDDVGNVLIRSEAES